MYARAFLPLILLLLAIGSVHAGALQRGYYYWKNVTVSPGTVVVDIINTTAQVHLFVVPKNDYLSFFYEENYTTSYNKTFGTGTYIIRLNPGNYTVITENPQLRNITVSYYLITVPLPSYIFNGAYLSYSQSAKSTLELLNVTPSQKTNIDGAIATNATLKLTFENYTESYANGDLFFTTASAGTETYTLSDLNIVNDTALITASARCTSPTLAGGLPNLCVETVQSQEANISQIFSESTTTGGGFFNSSEMAQLKNGTYNIQGQEFTVQPNRFVTVPAGTFKVYYVNGSATSGQPGSPQAMSGQAWVNMSSGVVDKSIISILSGFQRTTPLGGWTGTILSNTTITAELSGANIAQTPSTSTTTITGTGTVHTTTITQANKSSSGSGFLIGLVIGLVVIACVIYAVYRVLAWLIRRLRGRPPSQPQKVKKDGGLKSQYTKDQQPAKKSVVHHLLKWVVAAVIVIFLLGLIGSIIIAYNPSSTKGHTSTTPQNKQSVSKLSITVSDAPSHIAISSLDIKLKSLSVHSKTTDAWYGIPVESNPVYDIVALKNVYAMLGQAQVPTGSYDEMEMNLSSYNATLVNGTTEEVFIPNDSIDIPINFTVSSTSGGSTDWLNLDVNLAESLHEGTGNLYDGDIVFLPDIQTSFSENATLDYNPSDNIASVIVWGITPIYQSFGMEIDGGMFRNLIVANDTQINISDSGTIEMVNSSLPTSPGDYSVQVEQSVQYEMSCDQGYILGSDQYCHPECGSGNYCGEGESCSNNECQPNPTCESGYYLATDGHCYLINDTSPCPPGYYDGGNGYCYENPDYVFATCEDGYIMLQDGHCGLAGPLTNTECQAGEKYINGVCYEECGNGYCPQDAVCINDQCKSCGAGFVLDENGDCQFSSQESSTSTESTTTIEYSYTTEYTTTVISCPPGEYLYQDETCIAPLDCTDTFNGATAHFNPEEDDCVCDNGSSYPYCIPTGSTTIDYTYTTTVEPTCGANAYYDSSTGVCQCDTGYSQPGGNQFGDCYPSCPAGEIMQYDGSCFTPS